MGKSLFRTQPEDLLRAQLRACLPAADGGGKHIALHITGTIENDRSAWIAGYLNPYRGNVTLQIRVYKVIGGWQNTLVRTSSKAARPYHFAMTW